MAVYSGPEIVKDGLVLHLDAASNKSYPSQGLEVEYLIVAGGGGTSEFSGGGGAGGVRLGKIFIDPQLHSIVVGNGGTAITGVGSSSTMDGQNSSAFGVVAVGGGGGISSNASANGRSGGSGGGVGPRGGSGGIGVSGQGNSGGGGRPGEAGNNGGSGGGGGASESGQIGDFRKGGNGGNGLLIGIDGNNKYYGGGGAGFGDARNGVSIAGIPGLGGGGLPTNGQTGDNSSTDGEPNTGGGAGAGGPSVPASGRNGGSGIVIVRYRGSQRAKGGTVTTFNGWTIHTFLQSGNFEVGGFIGDISGNTNHGELVNGPTFNSDNLGSLVFDGVGNYIDIGDTSNYFPTGSTSHTFSVSFWVKSTDTSNHIFFGNQQISNERIYVAKHSNTWDIGWGNFAWGAGNVTSGTRRSATSNWTHLTMNVSAGVASLYVDGEFTFNKSDTTVNITGNLPLGAYTSQGSLDTNNMKPVSISSCLIYNRALTAAEIRQNFYATRGRYGV